MNRDGGRMRQQILWLHLQMMIRRLDRVGKSAVTVGVVCCIGRVVDSRGTLCCLSLLLR